MCVCVCVYKGGKGARQVNELVIRIDIASAQGFPKTMSTTLSISLICASSELSLSSSPPPCLSSPCLTPLYLSCCGPRLANLLLPLSSNKHTHQPLLFRLLHLYCFIHMSLFLFSPYLFSFTPPSPVSS